MNHFVRTLGFFLFFIVVAILAVCNGQKVDFGANISKLNEKMTEKEVINLIGKPDEIKEETIGGGLFPVVHRKRLRYNSAKYEVQIEQGKFARSLTYEQLKNPFQGFGPVENNYEIDELTTNQSPFVFTFADGSTASASCTCINRGDEITIKLSAKPKDSRFERLELVFDLKKDRKVNGSINFTDNGLKLSPKNGVQNLKNYKLLLNADPFVSSTESIIGAFESSPFVTEDGYKYTGGKTFSCKVEKW